MEKCVTQGNHKEAGNMGLPMHWLPSVFGEIWVESRKKIWLRYASTRWSRPCGRHHEIWDNFKLDTQLRILSDCNHIVWCLEDISKTIVWLISVREDNFFKGSEGAVRKVSGGLTAAVVRPHRRSVSRRRGAELSRRQAISFSLPAQV